MLKDLLTKKLCTHKNIEAIVYYQNECELIPVIKVYKEAICKKCGKIIEKTLVSEDPSCYYNIDIIEKKLRKQGVRNIEDILVEISKSN